MYVYYMYTQDNNYCVVLFFLQGLCPNRLDHIPNVMFTPEDVPHLGEMQAQTYPPEKLERQATKIIPHPNRWKKQRK